MVTFNHEKYISEAIESVLGQRTNASFRLFISDDCSTDATAKIAHRYEEKYPNHITLFKHKNNIGAQRNFATILERNRSSKYTALLDGDDYWTSPYKLQHQFEYMESKPEYAISFHKARVIYENEMKPSYTMPLQSHREESLTIYDLIHDYFIPTSSVMFKSGLVKEFPKWFHALPIGDKPLHILNAHHGNIGYMDHEMSVYRVHKNGIWSLKHLNNKVNYLREKNKMLYLFNQYFDYQYDHDIKISIARSELHIAIEQARKESKKEAKNRILDTVFRLKQENELIISFNLVTDNKKLILFGSGQYAENVKDLCEILGFRLVYAVDNDYKKWGTYFHDLPIYNPEELLKENKDEIIILVASMYFNDISAQLEKMGYKQNHQYVDGADLTFILQMIWGQVG